MRKATTPGFVARDVQIGKRMQLPLSSQMLPYNLLQQESGPVNVGFKVSCSRRQISQCSCRCSKWASCSTHLPTTALLSEPCSADLRSSFSARFSSVVCLAFCTRSKGMSSVPRTVTLSSARSLTACPKRLSLCFLAAASCTSMHAAFAQGQLLHMLLHYQEAQSYNKAACC